MLNKTDAPTPAEKKEAVVIKKYANRRLYNTETSTYVTLDDLAAMVHGDRDFVVFDAKTGDDLTHSVLTQIIVEQENRQGGQTLLPVPFLRQLIRFYDDSIGRMVPGYLQFSLENLARSRRSSARSSPAPSPIRPQPSRPIRSTRARTCRCSSRRCPCGARSRALPAGGKRGDQPEKAGKGAVPKESDELGELKAQLASMQQKIDKLSQDRE